MIVVDTPFHISYSSNKAKPKYACTGDCKKSFWDTDMEDRDKSVCPMCGGKIDRAIEGVHYKTLKRMVGLGDSKTLLRLGVIKEDEVKSFEGYLGSGASFPHLSRIKSKFEAYAMERWGPDANK